MDEQVTTDQLLRTKLHRPRIPVDFVVRPRLVKILERGRSTSLTLVSAPAGYGKSTLISSWLEQCNRPNAWLSLDEGDSDLAQFLNYFVAAVQELFPGACLRTKAVLRSSDLPPVAIIARELVNEITAIGKPFILVLDDYGRVHDQAIHDLLSLLLDHNLCTLHLVLITRRDPSLPLSKLRASGDMTEIRQLDLQLTAEETAAFLEKAIHIPVEDKVLVRLHEKTEGWAAGLRMLSIALRNRNDIDEFIREMKGDTRHIRDYLMAEVLSRQQPEIRAGLLKTSILNHFCPSLVDALCAPEIDGNTFIERLEESNLFSISLDDRHEWFRFHHLFQELLKRTLDHRYEPDEIAALHKRASTWFEEKGMIEEAFHHTMIGSDPEVAGKLVARHRHELMNNEQWHRLGRLLDMLPRAIIENIPELLIQDAWNLWNRMRIPEMVKVLDRVESLLAPMVKESATTREIQGEVDALRSVQYYLIPPCDGARALAYAQQAMQENPWPHSSTRGMAVIMMAMSYQLTGNLTDAFRVIFEELKQKDALRNTYHTRLLITFCLIYWVEADLVNLKQTGDQLLELSNELHLPESSDIGQHFLGVSHYCRNELAEVEKHLKGVVKNGNKINIFNFAHSAFVLSLTNQAQGRSTEACEIAESVVRYALDTGNTPLLQLAHAFQAELALRQGNIAEAVNWTKNYEPEPFTTAHRFYVPQLTLARILLAQNTTESRQQAAVLLSRLHDFYVSIHNTYCLINVLALQAMLNNALGDEPAALATLERAIIMAEAGGFIRIFLDLGPKMADLLQQLAERDVASKYIGSLLAASQESESGLLTDSSGHQPVDIAASNDPTLLESLSNRELDVLSLLSQRLSNKEVSGKLFISPETVKRHTINLYKKLDVHTRREAVDKAVSLGILS
jgi:LuxR family maltose regulon positive regulatory protein